MNNLYMLLAVVAGAGVAVQAVVNARLRLILGGPIWAAATQFIVGLTLLLLAGVLSRQPPPATDGIGRAPWWVWIGGLFGAIFILVSILLTPRLGAAVTLASTIVGQLSAALLIDHFGFFGASIVRVTPTRIAGVALLVLGVILMRR